jgi:hypothetical protein
MTLNSTGFNADGDDINHMKGSHTIEVTRRTFQSYLTKHAWQDIQESLGYDKGFRISRDWHVAYYRSTYQGVPCVYLVHSAIEHIFTEGT